MQGCAYRRRNATYVAHARVGARVDGAGVLRTADTRAQQSAAAGTTAGAARRAAGVDIQIRSLKRRPARNAAAPQRRDRTKICAARSLSAFFPRHGRWQINCTASRSARSGGKKIFAYRNIRMRRGAASALRG